LFAQKDAEFHRRLSQTAREAMMEHLAAALAIQKHIASESK
jgi:hypothetical protein